MKRNAVIFAGVFFVSLLFTSCCGRGCLLKTATPETAKPVVITNE